MKYRKKPIVIEAIKYDGQNLDKVMDFMGDSEGKKNYWACNETGGIGIETLEGLMRASVGDYIIKGIKGEFYPIKENIFNLTYEKVEND